MEEAKVGRADFAVVALSQRLANVVFLFRVELRERLIVTEFLSTVFSFGAALTDTLEGWVLALMGLVILLDFVVGTRRKPFLAFGIFQVAGLIGGYLWASWIAQQQDVAGPYAWAFVIGLWCIFAAAFHVPIVVTKLFARRQEP